MKNKGFTLIELSIVLVIIGLLVAGVIGGQSIVRSAQLRSVATEVQGIKTSLNTFKDYYDALPGDMDNAIDYWGAAHATPSTCKFTVGTGTQTCNGDGLGHVNRQTDASNDTYEMFRFWQHLVNAEMFFCYVGSYA